MNVVISMPILWQPGDIRQPKHKIESKVQLTCVGLEMLLHHWAAKMVVGMVTDVLLHLLGHLHGPLPAHIQLQPLIPGPLFLRASLSAHLFKFPTLQPPGQGKGHVRIPLQTLHHCILGTLQATKEIISFGVGLLVTSSVGSLLLGWATPHSGCIQGPFLTHLHLPLLQQSW